MTFNHSPNESICLIILLSGRGSNFKAIHQAVLDGTIPNTTIGLVISNKPDAPGLAWAKDQGLNTLALPKQPDESREAYDQRLVKAIQPHQPDWLVLAGYNRILTDDFIHAFEGKILNIHPSLLPKFGGPGMVGLKVHQAVIEAGETESGCTVHGVTTIVDGGPILGQRTVPVLPDDTAETLAARVLEQEHQLYPAVLKKLVLPSTAHPIADKL
jgi:phosphoribosylglycinamide formyltransferase, formyltetrahydrofolate-dependent